MAAEDYQLCQIFFSCDLIDHELSQYLRFPDIVETLSESAESYPVAVIRHF